MLCLLPRMHKSQRVGEVGRVSLPTTTVGVIDMSIPGEGAAGVVGVCVCVSVCVCMCA